MPLLVAAVLTMSVAQLLDLATFAELMRRVGPEAEANPLVATLFGAYGLPVVAIAKVALIALVTAIVAELVVRPPVGRVVAAIVVGILATGIVAGLVGGVTNTAALGLL
ncbi:MAG: hypothetical protein ABI620_06765 [Chloroflexota bacterium]